MVSLKIDVFLTCADRQASKQTIYVCKTLLYEKENRNSMHTNIVFKSNEKLIIFSFDLSKSNYSEYM
jgi:hypothetical protein